MTAFKLSDAKFNSEKWKSLKRHILQNNSDAASQTHHVCQYCRPVLNKDKMPSRCILNGLFTEPMPKELEALDPLSKQLIQRRKAFQVVVRVGTHTRKVTIHSRHVRGLCFSYRYPFIRHYKPLRMLKTVKMLTL